MYHSQAPPLTNPNSKQNYKNKKFKTHMLADVLSRPVVQPVLKRHLLSTQQAPSGHTTMVLAIAWEPIADSTWRLRVSDRFTVLLGELRI